MSFAENMGSLFRRYPRPIISAILSVVLIILIYFSDKILPGLEDREAEAARKVDVVLKNISQGADLADQLQLLKKLTAGMNGRLVSVDDKAVNYQFFYDIEARSRASISDIHQTTTDIGDGVMRAKLTEFSALGFNLTVSGRIGYVMSFLKRMEGGKYFVRCNSLVLRGNKTLGPDAVDAVLRLEVLSKK